MLGLGSVQLLDVAPESTDRFSNALAINGQLRIIRRQLVGLLHEVNQLGGEQRAAHHCLAKLLRDLVERLALGGRQPVGRRLAVSDPAPNPVGQLLEDLGPLVLKARTNLDLDWYAVGKHDHVHGPVTLHRLGAPVDDLRLSRRIIECANELDDHGVLAIAVEVAAIRIPARSWRLLSQEPP